MKLHLKTTVALITLVCAGVLASTASAAAPANTGAPTISGREQQGRTLTATPGTWTGSPTSFAYRWQRCAADGTGCQNIDNAAAKTYTVAANDVGRTLRVVVTATNADGSTSAMSKTTGIVSGTTAPVNTARPTISGTPQPAETLTADPGTWSGGPRTFAYQWQHCDAAGANCADVVGATGKTYGVRSADVGGTLRVKVTATNLVGSSTTTSDRTEVVKTPSQPPTTTAPVPSTNHRPTIAILSVRFVGRRVYTRMRVCDDSRRNLGITERDTKAGVPSYTRHFRTLIPPKPCSALTRSWIPAPRFRHGRYVIRIWARDAFGLTSRIASRAIVR
jgi:hypothetical protein